MNNKFTVTIDLGGTKVLSALLNSQNEIVGRVKIATDIKRGADFLVDNIGESVRQLIQENSIKENDIRAVSMGVPGTVNPFTGLIGNAPNLGISNYNIKEALKRHFTAPVLIENDVNLAGLGIQKFEMEKDVKNMIVVFIGTGIGSALFFDGKLYRGSSFFAGEIGHMLVDSNGGFLKKKKSSTFENAASRTAIVRKIKKDLAKDKPSILNEYSSPNKALKSRALSEAIEKKDPLAVKHIGKAARTIGTVLGSITTLLNIDTIVLGGGVIEAMEKFMVPRITEAYNESVLPEPGKDVKIIATKLGDDAALYGGIALADEFLV